MQQEKTNIFIEMVLCYKYGWRQHTEFEKEATCSICLEDLKGKYILETACNHYYHRECAITVINNYKPNQCPQCYAPFTIIPKDYQLYANTCNKIPKRH